MKLSTSIFAFCTLTSSSAFITSTNSAFRTSHSSDLRAATPYFMEEIKPFDDKRVMKKPSASNKKNSPHKEGIFSPVVLAAKNILGDEKLNKIRAKGISLHSDVISSFVDTYDSAFGRAIAQQLFVIMDKNKDGKLDEVEIAEALQSIGFDWLREKQVKGILARADANSDGFVDFNEYLHELPKTLRTNLIKLAKKNGGDLGFLV